MRSTAIRLLEETFLRTGNNGEYGLQKIAIPVPGEPLTLEGFLCTPQHRTGYYHDVAHPKQRIVIHYTAGSLRSDLETLTTQNRHVSVPFVIARDGTIYQLFSSRFWSGHIGKGVGNTNTGNAQDKCTIGIELSNYGWLTEREGALETCYSRQKNRNGVPGPADVYCSLTETDAYQKLDTPFRQQAYYATYTAAQYQRLIILLRYLTAKFDIPRAFLPESLRFQTTDAVLNFKGIVSHVNYRSDGKWDIGPAFDWDNVIDGVQAAAFAPILFRDAVPMTRGGAFEKPLTSEEEIEPLLPEPGDASLENEPYDELQKSFDEAEAGMGVLKSSGKPDKKKLYALLVGLDEYNEKIALNGAVVFPKLSGCVPDSKRMKTYLENDPAFEAHIKWITNEQATKSEIARLFREHLGQAKENDTALFFFSGHGTQEWAETGIWKEDTDGKLECIVCYYDQESDDMLLADKELRFLLHELSKGGAHIAAIFDCCHSADNTRNGAIVKKEFNDIVEKRIPFAFPERPWNKFLFSNAISKSDVKHRGEAAMLPEGAHVQLSACESNESALEVGGSGVFTKALLQVLKAAGGDLSYQSIGSRTRQYLKNVYEQKPRIYVAGGHSESLYANFLNRPSTGEKQTFGELVYNEERGWKFTLGALHGIDESTKSIRIADPETNEIYSGEIGEVEIDCCFVTTGARLKKTKIYNGIVEGLLSKSIKVSVQKEESSLKEVQPLLDLLFEEAKYYVVTEDEEESADYVVRVQNDMCHLTYPADPFRPLTAPQSLSNKKGAKSVVEQLIHISKWEFLKALQNKSAGNKLPDDLLKIDLTVGNDLASVDETGAVVINYDNNNGVWENTITVKLTNTSSKNLYCSAIHLTSDFGADADLLNPPVYLLEPGNTVHLSYERNPALTLELNDVVEVYNQKEEIEHLRFIISTEPFDVQALLLEPLPKPPLPGARQDYDTKRTGTTRGIRKRSLNGWTTKTITLRLQNPLFNKLPAVDKIKMFLNEETSLFAWGLYSDVIIRDDTLVEQETIQPTRRNATGVKKTKAAKRGDIDFEPAKLSPAAPPAVPDETFAGASPSALELAIPPAPAPAPSTSIAAKSREGQLEYDIPGQMQTGKAYMCRIAIAGAEVDAASMKLGEASVHATIRVGEEMSVHLLDASGGDHFTIVPLSTERQSLDTGEMTKWSFAVTPKQSGNYPLLLKITIHQNGKNKDLDILEKDVLVSASDTGVVAVSKNNITRILFIAANPSNTSPLRIGAETRQIKEEIGLAAAREKFLFTMNLAVTTRTLSRAILQEDPAIVHFSGHGEEEGLCLETESGMTKLVTAAALDVLFENFAGAIKCVILNACYSKAQAEAIVKHIPYVIGMNQSVQDEVALAFSVGFYQALVDGCSIEQAFNLGLAGMAMMDSAAENGAVLLKKPD
jgi:N-acetyl-anhydromuramyl-L-alanine amidase AmpD